MLLSGTIHLFVLDHTFHYLTFHYVTSSSILNTRNNSYNEASMNSLTSLANGRT